ncbi:AraC family transcriptional regulator [Actinoplanes sp. TBRC 11911]|uniref:helix-turn-helix domain-containing protein n=1 Tax=Actinoplanes sp. TBRC 11911 TaxID=2729386 RepID=UPI00145EC16B|nr:AraC family transcriptional regulator [Actinoplanes sp. TBRC 11911]NMO56840.1 AraC family transcriptional regulator [Actinoplanes sp. TBRC 11911]
MRLTTAGGSLHVARTLRLAAESTGDELLGISVGTSGNLRVHQDGRLAATAPGDVVLYQARSVWELTTAGNSETQLMKFSRDSLPPRVRDVSESIQALQIHSAATSLLGRYIDQLDRSAAELTAVQRVDAGQAAITLLVMALRGPETALPDGSDHVLLDMVKRYIKDHISEPLAIEVLARIHHVSVRHLYHLFERADTTPGAYIRTQRLLAAYNVLADPKNMGIEIWRVAAMTGFANIRTFNRAFRQKFGKAPADWRHEGRRIHPQGRARESGC